MTRKERVNFLIIRSIGNFLFLMGLYMVFLTFSPVITQEFRFRVAKARGITYTVKEIRDKQQVARNKREAVNGRGEETSNKKLEPQSSLISVLLDDTQDRILIPPDTLFSIMIPKIGAVSKVIPNVDPTDESAFRKVLLNGVAHAKGTVFPGMQGNIYLFAHSTDNFWSVGHYNAVFYLLKELQKGDEIVIFFEDVRHNYTVTDTFITDPDNVSFLVNSRGKEEQLVLQTCWPPGTTWKRLFVLAKPTLQARDIKK
jgi:sortase A